MISRTAVPVPVRDASKAIHGEQVTLQIGRISFHVNKSGKILDVLDYPVNFYGIEMPYYYLTVNSRNACKAKRSITSIRINC
jgi:hypothetical protein